MAPQPMAQMVCPHRLQSGIADEHFEIGAGRRVRFEDRRNILARGAEETNHVVDELTHPPKYSVFMRAAPSCYSQLSSKCLLSIHAHDPETAHQRNSSLCPPFSHLQASG